MTNTEKDGDAQKIVLHVSAHWRKDMTEHGSIITLDLREKGQNMTKDEAIKQIVEDRMEDIMDCPFIYDCETDDCWSCGMNEAYAMALDALFRERNYEAKTEKHNELKAKG